MPIIGIDLGTTNSLASVYQNGKSKLIPNPFGEFHTPSVVSVDDDAHILVGKAAKERLVSHPEHTAAAFKRSMGTNKKYILGQKTFTPEELSSFVLRRLKEDAEAFLGEKVEQAVISVPAHFNHKQRAATKMAGLLAGLSVERLINEPSAAALSCYDPAGGDAAFLVCDFGGGTLDVSVVDCFENVVNILAVSGSNHLGGADFDEAIAQMYCKKNKIDYQALSPQLKAILLMQAERCKKTLSVAPVAVIVLEVEGLKGSLTLTGASLIKGAKNLFSRLREPLQKALKDSTLLPEDLHAVIPVGGSCNMPLMRQYLTHLMGRPLAPIENSETTIALGAGMYAAMKMREDSLKDMVLTDICPFTLGVGVHDPNDSGDLLMSPVIERNSALPTSKVEKYYTVTNGQTLVEVQVYQGESRHCNENLKLGELVLPLPAAPAGKEGCEVRFTYDINGILEIEASSLSTNEKISTVLVGEGSGFTQAEARQYLKKLKHLKIHPRNQEQNRLLLARCERMWTEALGDERRQISEVARWFEANLATQEAGRIRYALHRCTGWLDALETGAMLDTFDFDSFDEEE